MCIRDRFSEGIRREADELKKFLFDNLYRHYRVLRMTTKARRIVRELFAAFLDDPRPVSYTHLDVYKRQAAIPARC